MGVVENTTLSGNVSTNGTPINVVLPTSQQIDIQSTSDSVAIGNSSGVLADVTALHALKTDSSAVTQPVSAVALPLPTGAASASNQTAANTSLASIDTKLTSPVAVTGPITDAQLRATPISVVVPVGALRLDDTSTANVIYVGNALVGSLTASAVWQIKKVDQTTGLVITWAGSAAFNQIWDNRTSLSYS